MTKEPPMHNNWGNQQQQQQQISYTHWLFRINITFTLDYCLIRLLALSHSPYSSRRRRSRYKKWWWFYGLIWNERKRKTSTYGMWMYVTTIFNMSVYYFVLSLLSLINDTFSVEEKKIVSGFVMENNIIIFPKQPVTQLPSRECAHEKFKFEITEN